MNWPYRAKAIFSPLKLNSRAIHNDTNGKVKMSEQVGQGSKYVRVLSFEIEKVEMQLLLPYGKLNLAYLLDCTLEKKHKVGYNYIASNYMLPLVESFNNQKFASLSMEKINKQDSPIIVSLDLFVECAGMGYLLTAS